MIATKDQKPKTANPPPDLADVAFLDMRDLTAAASMSASWIYDEIRAGRFPEPLRFGNRCTRWRASEVRRWLIQRAAAPQAPMLVQRATKASKAAVTARAAKRTAAADQVEGNHAQ